jgi:hypothetical protein
MQADRQQGRREEGEQRWRCVCRQAGGEEGGGGTEVEMCVQDRELQLSRQPLHTRVAAGSSWSSVLQTNSGPLLPHFCQR